MELKEIEIKIEETLTNVSDEIYDLQTRDKPIKVNEGKYTQIIMSKLHTIIGNSRENPIFRRQEAEEYYFDDLEGLTHIQDKYQLILDLQDFIVAKSGLPFIYDKFSILKILQLTQNQYNEFIEDCNTGLNARDEDISNIFLDIETMLIADRNNSAEAGTRNAKAIDTGNRYKREHGGFGMLSENEKKDNSNLVIEMTPENVLAKLNAFGNSLENKKEKS